VVVRGVVMMIMIHDHVDDRGDVGWGDGNFTGPAPTGNPNSSTQLAHRQGAVRSAGRWCDAALSGGATQLLASDSSDSSDTSGSSESSQFGGHRLAWKVIGRIRGIRGVEGTEESEEENHD
jgi:hypothetical protein